MGDGAAGICSSQKFAAAIKFDSRGNLHYNSLKENNFKICFSGKLYVPRITWA
jgi:hypothetical protein